MKKDILIYFDLITSLKTTKEVSHFASEIDTLLQTLFKSEKSSLEKALNQISTESAGKITQVFSKNNLDINDKDAVTGFFETLKKLMKKFKVIKLILAFDPSSKTILSIHEFIRDTLGIGFIMDIEVDPEILGGAVVIFNGQYNDFTLKKTVEDAFESKKEEVSSLLSS